MGYFKTRCLMLFKDYNSLNENGVAKLKKKEYLDNTISIEEAVKKSKTSILNIVFTIVIVGLYIAYILANVLPKSDEPVYINPYPYKVFRLSFIFFVIYFLCYFNVNIRKSNFLRIISFPMLVDVVYSTAVICYLFLAFDNFD